MFVVSSRPTFTRVFFGIINLAVNRKSRAEILAYKGLILTRKVAELHYCVTKDEGDVPLPLKACYKESLNSTTTGN